MNALAQLHSHMLTAKETLVGDKDFGQAAHMAKAVEKMRANVSGKESGITRDRIKEALTLVDSKGVNTACESHLRYLCWALWEPTARLPALMKRTDSSLRSVLDVAHRDLSKNALSLSAWRGLIAAYFNPNIWPNSEPESANWLVVREFLSVTLPMVISLSRFVPDWLRTLKENPELLGANPCGRYAAATASGDTSTIDIIRQNLSVPAESWFWKELILSQVRHLCSLSDTVYKAGLDKILAMLGSHPMLADDALIAILPRHHRAMPDFAHVGLQDYAVKSWGSPNIFSQAKWCLVEDPVKQMVREWLVKEDLNDFFSLLQADRAADQRRLSFWLDYAKQIDYAHFALGGKFWQSQQADYGLFAVSRG